MELTIQNVLNKISDVNQETELEKKLEDINLPLTEYLNHPDAIQCFQDMKKNAVKYFNRDKIKQLIKYITTLPKKDDHNNGYKYPFIASEMLRTANERIKDMIIFSEEDYNNKYNIINDIKKEEGNSEQKSEVDNKLKEKSENNEEVQKRNENLKEKEANHEGENKIDNKDEEKDKKNNKNDIIEIKENDTKDKNGNLKKEENKKEQKEVKKPRKCIIDKHNDILDLLLDFVTKKKTVLNDVLCGYFHKVLSALMDNYSIDIFLYLFFVRKDVLEQMVMLSYKNSISTILIQILNIRDIFLKVRKNYSTNPEMVDIKFLKNKKVSLEEYRMNLLEKIITSIDLDGLKDCNGEYLKDVDVENIFYIFLELIKTDFVEELFWNKKVFPHIFKILEKNVYFKYEPSTYFQKSQKIYNYFVILLGKILYYSISSYQERGKYYPEFDYEDLFDRISKKENLDLEDFLIIYIPKILSTNFVPYYKENTLGIHIIYLMDLVIALFKYFGEKPNLYDFIILQSGFLEKSITYFFKYQLNNIYHSKFVKLFTLYLEKADVHPLLTDYFFVKRNFPLMLSYYITKKYFREENKNQFYNKCKYKSGKEILSCVNIYVIDLIYKIQAACGVKILEEKDKKQLGISNYGFFEFLKDDKSPKEREPFKLPTYIKFYLSQDMEWKNLIEKIIIPKIKKFEGKLLCTKPIKPRPVINVVPVNNKQNESKNNIPPKDKKSEIKIKIDEYDDINYWKMENSISEDIKKNVNLNINKKNKDDIEDEDELLNIAIQLEKQEKCQNKIKSSEESNNNIVKTKEIKNSSSQNENIIDNKTKIEINVCDINVTNSEKKDEKTEIIVIKEEDNK